MAVFVEIALEVCASMCIPSSFLDEVKNDPLALIAFKAVGVPSCEAT